MWLISAYLFISTSYLLKLRRTFWECSGAYKISIDSDNNADICIKSVPLNLYYHLQVASNRVIYKDTENPSSSTRRLLGSENISKSSFSLENSSLKSFIAFSRRSHFPPLVRNRRIPLIHSLIISKVFILF